MGCFVNATASKDGFLTFRLGNLAVKTRRSMVVCNWRRVAVFNVLCDILNMFSKRKKDKRQKVEKQPKMHLNVFLSTGGEINSDDEICCKSMFGWLFYVPYKCLTFLKWEGCVTFCPNHHHVFAKKLGGSVLQEIIIQWIHHMHLQEMELKELHRGNENSSLIRAMYQPSRHV